MINNYPKSAYSNFILQFRSTSGDAMSTCDRCARFCKTSPPPECSPQARAAM
jgi:hypothetical protein